MMAVYCSARRAFISRCASLTACAWAALISPRIGVLMASVGLLESIMGFTPDQTALVMTLYLALDGYGPGCNVTGDGAIAIVIDKLFKKK